MRAVLASALLALLGGCLGLPEQKLADGQVGCATVTGMQGTASYVIARADNAPRGSNASGKVRVTCGSAVMEMENTVTQPSKQ